MRFEGKVAIITGAGRGIGKAIAERLASEGADVVVCDIDKEAAERTAEEIRSKYSVKAIAISADVAKEGDVNSMVEETIKNFGRVDFLINNAGITKDSLLLRMSEEEWDKVIAVDLKSVFLCTRAVIRHMMRQRFGRIVNISSVIGLRGNVGQANYASAKAGIIGFTKSSARELAGRNITVNAVAPGYIQTEMTERLPQDVREEMLKQVPLGRPGQPEDVAGVVAFLCSEDASYITGEIIRVDGGMAM
ncbi:3-oxoacyl-[acyl-carrier-protein] reductase [bacterium]|nr:3-oxoacyl-[acyl-carrier-protein] reductase [bacterium]